MRIAIIGAGMAGLTCARALADAGHAPIVFEKSRGLGGRLATRRVEALRFDHGAQFATAQGPGFKSYLTEHAARWSPEGAKGDWFVGAPGMNALVKPMADGLDLRLGEQVAPQRTGGAWQIGNETFDRVISTVPVPQARTLFPEATEALEAVRVAPCWALMLAFDTATDWPDLHRSDSDALAWIARNSAKPSRDTAPECWAIHAAPDWSTTHLERDKDVVCEHMLDLLRAARGTLPEPIHAAAHRWRYAKTITPLGQTHLALDGGSLLIGGDWCLGARVEDAYESGLALANAVA